MFSPQDGPTKPQAFEENHLGIIGDHGRILMADWAGVVSGYALRYMDSKRQRLCGS